MKHRLLAFLVALGLLAATPAAARIRTHFTSVLKDQMDVVLADLFRKAEVRAKAGRPGTIDVMVFSFTTQALADELLRIADAWPQLVQVRVMLDTTQMSSSESHQGPYLYHATRAEYDEACRAVCEKPDCETACRARLEGLLGGRKLSNLQVKYWFYDAWVWNPSTKRPVFNQSRAKLLHHKSVVVNRQILATGSYNWSASAAKTNYENVQVFSGTREQGIVREFLAEYDAIWNDPARSVTTEEGDARKREIWDRLEHANGGSVP